MYDVAHSWSAVIKKENKDLLCAGDVGQKYELASLSKAITAMAIVLLCIDGKISLDDDVSLYCEKFIFHDRKKKRRRVTFRNLLQHTSGMGKNTIGFQKEGETSIFDVAKKISESSLVSESGETFCYATGGYVVLGALVEAISQKSFADYVKERIFEPLGMNHSTAEGNALTGYKRSLCGYSQVKWKGCKAFCPAGYIVSTTKDMERFLGLFITGVSCDERLAEAARICCDVTQFVETNTEGVFYGFGWFWNKEYDFFYHDGYNPGFRSFMGFKKENKMMSVWMLNCNEPTFSRYAEETFLKLIRQENIDDIWHAPKHAGQSLLLIIELLTVALILCMHAEYLLLLVTFVILFSLAICHIKSMMLSQIMLWLDRLQIGIMYSSGFMLMVIIISIFNTIL
jgi:CubicO group peptidase (beta-lactamase class C family)